VAKKKATKSQKLTVGILKVLGIPFLFFPGLILASLLGWNWKGDLARLEERGGFKQSEVIFPSFARVVEVKDGDTFTIDSGLNVRMLGIDAPPRRSPEGIVAKKYLENLILDEKVVLEYESYQDDKYGRILAYVWEECTTSLGLQEWIKIG